MRVVQRVNTLLHIRRPLTRPRVGAVVLAGGRFPFGIGLLVLWAIISLVRTFLEPKIVGDQIGLHPLVTLTAMYFGLRSAGVAGMLAVPLMCMIAVRLQADGSLKIYR